MKKLLLTLSAALLGLAAFAQAAVPSVEPTAGAITIAFQVPADMECTPIIQFVGDASTPSWTPGSDANPEAVALSNGWYKLVLDGTYTQGKIVPINADGITAGWKYQGYYVQVEGHEVTWLTISGDGEHQLVFGEGKLGAVCYLQVTRWQSDPCVCANPEGDATIELSFDIPEEIDPEDYEVIMLGQGAGVTWGELGRLSYDGDFKVFKGVVEVPAGCSYKYQLALVDATTGAWEVRDGNRSMPCNNQTKDEIEWPADAWADPIPAGTGNFTVSFVGSNPSAESIVYIAGNFEDTPAWERIYSMTYNATKGAYEAVGLAYPENFTFKFVVSTNSTEEWLGVGGGDENFKFDGETFDYEVPYTVGAEEESADAAVSTYKVVENGQVVIVKGDKKYNLLGAEIK